MKTFSLRHAAVLFVSSILLAGQLNAQGGAEHAAPQSASSERPQGSPGVDHPAGEEAKKVDIILPHISDSDELDTPWANVPGLKAAPLPHWAPIHIGSFALDLSPTKHVVMMLLAAVLACIILIGAARAHVRHTAQ